MPQRPPAPPAPNTGAQPSAPPRRDQLVRQVAERVWQLWQEELRREQERRGDRRRGS